MERALDPQGINQLFTFWTPLAPTTVFRNIQEVPPGHNLWVCDGTKAETDLGFRPVVSLEEGVAGCAGWYAEQGWLS